MKETPVLEFTTVSCVPPEDNRPAERPGIKTLVEGVRLNGQLVPGLVCPHPDTPDKFQILDGVGRWYACGILGIPFRAMLLPGVVPEDERIRLRLQHNVIRRNMTAEEIADDADRYMKLLGRTQEEAARELLISSATLSRARTTQRRIPPEMKPLVDLVRPSVASMIASLPSVEAMQKAFAFATTAGTDGKLPTRDQVGRFLEQFKAKRSRGPKVTTLRGQVDGRKVELAVLPGESTETLIEFLKSLAGKIGKYKDLPPDALGFIFSS